MILCSATFRNFFSPMIVGNHLNNLPTPINKFETTFDDHLRDKLIKSLGQGEVESKDSL